LAFIGEPALNQSKNSSFPKGRPNEVRARVGIRNPYIRGQPPAPFHATPRGFIGPQLLATILFDKFGMHIPLSHSGRRTFITNAARKISTVGGSLRDVQELAGHSNIRTTQRYIDANPEAQLRVVELV
jgi:integrase